MPCIFCPFSYWPNSHYFLSKCHVLVKISHYQRVTSNFADHQFWRYTHQNHAQRGRIFLSVTASIRQDFVWPHPVFFLFLFFKSRAEVTLFCFAFCGPPLHE